MKLIDQIKKFKPCKKGVKWLGNRSLEQFWNECDRSDWMMWYLGNFVNELGYPTTKEIIFINVQIVRSVQYLMKDQRSIDALDVFEKYALGNASEEEFINARKLAASASAWAWASASASASYSASASASAWASASASALASASASASASDRYFNLLQNANLIRTLWPFEKFKTMNIFKEELKKLNACEDALIYIGNQSFDDAWNNCERPYWMLWYLSKKKGCAGFPDSLRLLYIETQVARSVQHLMKDQRSIDALDVYERYSLGEATKDEFELAKSAATAAYTDAYAAAYAAYAAAYAAYATAADAAYAAAAAYADAYDAYDDYATAADAADAARKKINQENADLIRSLWPFEKFKI
jgi:uncharacterized membrane protein